MARIVVSGYIVRLPLGGQSWHYVQYLAGLARLGHDVHYVEEFGWPTSCFDPEPDAMTSDPTYGIRFLRNCLQAFGLGDRWCYLAEDGTAHGMTRAELATVCRDADLYLNIGNVNSIPETEECRRRALIDADPVFTQITDHGLERRFDAYDVLFTFGENVGRAGSEIPTLGLTWLPTRQPVVLDLWRADDGDPSAPFTTVMNWAAYDEYEHDGRVYGQKDREFEPYFSFPHETGEPMELTVKAPPDVEKRLVDGGWRVVDPAEVTNTPATYQRYISASRGEFSVAKHGYVSTRCGWFSERSAAYLASGRPVVVQDTGFSENLPVGKGVLAFSTRDEAAAAVENVASDYRRQSRAARPFVEEHFDSDDVLTRLVDQAL